MGDFSGRNWAHIMTLNDGTVVMAEWLRNEPPPNLFEQADWLSNCRLGAEAMARRYGTDHVHGVIMVGDDVDGVRRLCAFLSPSDAMLACGSDVFDP